VHSIPKQAQSSTLENDTSKFTNTTFEHRNGNSDPYPQLNPLTLSPHSSPILHNLNKHNMHNQGCFHAHHTTNIIFIIVTTHTSQHPKPHKKIKIQRVPSFLRACNSQTNTATGERLPPNLHTHYIRKQEWQQRSLPSIEPLSHSPHFPILHNLNKHNIHIRDYFHPHHATNTIIITHT
jgi:hypothetical protein